jgi:cobyrinic acid a,c-diamide synthase
MEAVKETVTTPCLGGIVNDEKIAIPERHLGLVTQEDHAFDQGAIDRLADVVEKSMDLDVLVKTLPEIRVPQGFEPLSVGTGEKTVRIAVAKDNAFCFYYQDNLELLEGQGAELVFFSPIAGDELPRDIGGLYLGGGYPELFGDELANNRNLRHQVRAKSDAGMPIYGECGGFMYLCESLLDRHGNRYPMAGIFPFTTAMFPRLKALGYREITLTRHTPIGEQGMILRGHEFHYSELTTHTPGIPSAYRISDRSGLDKPPDGYLTRRTLGSYNHLHFGSQPQAAKYFVDNCLAYQRLEEKRK